MPMELAGEKFGRWTVLRRSTAKRMYWVCQCECGTERDVAHGALRSGKSLSCGCYLAERTGERSLKHGHSRVGKLTPTYHAWRAMHDMCFIPTDQSFYRAGGRGIGMDPAWKEFTAFLRDMGEKPHKATLDRRDEMKDFSRENCYWRPIGTSKTAQKSASED